MELSNQQKMALRKELMKLYPTIDGSKVVLEDADIPTGNITYNSAPKLNWNAIIKETQNHNRILDLIDIVLAEYPNNNVLIELKNELGNDLPKNQEPSPSAPIPPSNSGSSLDEQIMLLKRFIAIGNFDDVIEKLLKLSSSVSNDYQNMVFVISGHYHSLKREISQQIISPKDAKVAENKIRIGLLNTIDSLKSEIQLYSKFAEFDKNINQEITNETIRESFQRKNLMLKQTDQELEKVIGKRPNFVHKSWFLNGLQASNSVGRIYIKNSGGFAGTGFLLKGGYLLTNQHVIKHQNSLEGSFIEFGFTDKAKAEDNIYRFEFDSSFYHSSPYKSDGIPDQGAYDYALVKVSDNGKIPLEDLGYVSLEKDILPVADDPVNIIQYPGGGVQQFSLTANEVITNWDHYLYYKADTKPGSSGSPVFNQQWKVVALHHAGLNEKSNEGGLQIDSSGTIRPSNRGILIKYIIEDLEKKGIKID